MSTQRIRATQRLCIWCRPGDDRTVELLLQNGADVHARDQSDSTPLHLAASRGSARAVELCFSMGRIPRTRSGPLNSLTSGGVEGEPLRPFDYYSSTGRMSTLAMGATRHLCTWQSLIRLTVTDVVRLLLESGANVDLGDDKGRTPFQIASSRRNNTISQLLSEYRTNVE
jgi:ankyrin repeat protein